MHRADNPTTFICRLSWNLGASTSWNPQGLSRPVMGLLYLFTVYIEIVNIWQSTFELTSWSQSELLSLSEPEYLCTCNYMVKFCEWFANICETLCPCDLHQCDSLSVLMGCVLSCDSLVMRVGHLPAAQSLWQWDLIYLDGLPVILGEYRVWNTRGGKHRAVTNISSLV